MIAREVDGYWLRIGALMVEVLGESLSVELTPQRQKALAEYFGGLLDAAYDMGIRLGQATERYKQKQRDD